MDTEVGNDNIKPKFNNSGILKIYLKLLKSPKKEITLKALEYKGFADVFGEKKGHQSADFTL